MAPRVMKLLYYKGILMAGMVPHDAPVAFEPSRSDIGTKKQTTASVSVNPAPPAAGGITGAQGAAGPGPAPGMSAAYC